MRGRETSICEMYFSQLPLAHPELRDLARNLGMCPDWELNQQPFSFQASTQSTEPHHPGLQRILMERKQWFQLDSNDYFININTHFVVRVFDNFSNSLKNFFVLSPFCFL